MVEGALRFLSCGNSGAGSCVRQRTSRGFFQGETMRGTNVISRPNVRAIGTRSSNRRRLSFLLAACVSMTLAISGTAQASLLTNILSTVTIPTGLTQLGQGVTGLLTGAQTSLTVGQAA